ncbi:Cruciform DNA binding protein, partial [Tieghemiomyces parasiticus]
MSDSKQASTASATVSHTFTWDDGHPETVIVTGSFDAWSQSTTLDKCPASDSQADAPTHFSKAVNLPTDMASITYKYVVDGEWRLHPGLQTVLDESGFPNHSLSIDQLLSACIQPESTEHEASKPINDDEAFAPDELFRQSTIDNATASTTTTETNPATLITACPPTTDSVQNLTSMSPITQNDGGEKDNTPVMDATNEVDPTSDETLEINTAHVSDHAAENDESAVAAASGLDKTKSPTSATQEKAENPPIGHDHNEPSQQVKIEVSAVVAEYPDVKEKPNANVKDVADITLNQNDGDTIHMATAAA